MLNFIADDVMDKMPFFNSELLLLSDFFSSLITAIIFNLAGAPGFEPGMAGSKPAALPLG